MNTLPPHFFVQKAYFFSEFLTLNVHVFHVYLSPRRGLPIFYTCPHNANVIPKLLKREKSYNDSSTKRTLSWFINNYTVFLITDPVDIRFLQKPTEDCYFYFIFIEKLTA